MIGGERAVKEELAIAEVPEIAVALATVERQVIAVARVNSPAVARTVEGPPEVVAGLIEAAPQAVPAPLKASIAVVARHAAPASAVVPAGQALAGVEVPEAEAAVHEAGEAAEDDEDRSVLFSAISFRLENGTLERWNIEGM